MLLYRRLVITFRVSAVKSVLQLEEDVDAGGSIL